MDIIYEYLGLSFDHGGGGSCGNWRVRQLRKLPQPIGLDLCRERGFFRASSSSIWRPYISRTILYQPNGSVFGAAQHNMSNQQNRSLMRRVITQKRTSRHRARTSRNALVHGGPCAPLDTRRKQKQQTKHTASNTK